MKFKSALFVLFFVLFGWLHHAQAQTQETRVALVIGNSNYKSAPLKNPVNDARDMAVKLRGLGFTVVERNNLVVKQIGSTLREFRSKLTPGSVALVYYAGHGLQIKGDNYFPTVDADITGEEDVPNQSLAMKQIMDVLGDAKTRLNLVFLDACRNNPYSRSFRSGSDGLSKVNAPTGTLISFATRPGSVAADGVGRNGLYTGALLEAMDNSGQPIEQVLKRVVTSVKAGSRNQQEPWMEGSIEGEFCFGNCMTVAQVGVSDDRALWDSVKDSRDVNELKVYLAQFPSGVFAGLASARVKAIEQGSTSQLVATVTIPIVTQNSPLKSEALVKDCVSCPSIEMIVPNGTLFVGVNGERQSPEIRLEDEGIELRIANGLRQNLTSRAHVNVTSYNRMVLLTGEVSSEDEKDRAGRLAKSQKNLIYVVNDLAIEPASALTQRSKDAITTGQIKALFVEAKDLQPNAFKIITERGVVYLMGRVTYREAQRASEIALSGRVRGVVKVVRLFEYITVEELSRVAAQRNIMNQ